MKEREFNKLSHTIYECIYHNSVLPEISQEDFAR
jgi:hypothetical protein